MKNFYSIEDRLEIDLTVPAKTPVDPRFISIDIDSDLRIQKVLCLIGANASGKTSILRAIGFLRMFLAHSFDICRTGNGVPISAFDDEEGDDCITSLEIEFVVPPEIRTMWAFYKYSLNVCNAEPESYIKSETLEATNKRSSYTTIFDRNYVNGTYKIKSHTSFGLKRDDPRAKARSNVSLISNLLQFEHEPSEEFSTIFEGSFLSNVSVNKNNMEEENATSYLKINDEALTEFIRIVRKIDVGISDFEIDEVEGEDKPFFIHDGRTRANSLFFESQGTKNFYCLFPFLSYAKINGATAAIDELDSDLHPHLVAEIIRWFQDGGESHQYAQLITTLNHPSVLGQLEKEEVGIVEKNHRGRTTYIPLSNFEGVRRDTNIYKKYMGGHFGGLPVFG